MKHYNPFGETPAGCGETKYRDGEGQLLVTTDLSSVDCEECLRIACEEIVAGTRDEIDNLYMIVSMDVERLSHARYKNETRTSTLSTLRLQLARAMHLLRPVERG